MQRFRWGAAIVLTLFMISTVAAQDAPTSAPSAPTGRFGRGGFGRGRGPAGPAPSATQPALQRGTNNRHQSFLEIAQQGDIDLLFLGDSITDFWRREDAPGRPGGKAVWDEYFAPLKAANFGINADRTQALLYRVQNGELEGFKAKCIVLLIGTNNLAPDGSRNTVDETTQAYQMIVKEIRDRQPQAKLLLLAIFPRGDAADNPYRPDIRKMNEFIATLADNKDIFFMDIGDKFLDAQGNLPRALFPDALHPGDAGFRIWAEAIIGKVKELMAME